MSNTMVRQTDDLLRLMVSPRQSRVARILAAFGLSLLSGCSSQSSSGGGAPNPGSGGADAGAGADADANGMPMGAGTPDASADGPAVVDALPGDAVGEESDGAGVGLAEGGSGSCSPTAAGPGGAGAASVAGSQMPAFPALSNPFTVAGLDSSGHTDVGPIIQQAVSSHSQIIIPGSGNFGSPYQYQVATQVNVPDGAIIECEPGAQFLDPTDCLGDMPGLFWWSNETASVAGAGMYGCMFKGTASGSNYQTSYAHAFIRLQSGHNFTIEGNITTNSCGDADIRLDGPENSASDHGSTGNTIAFNNTNYAENGIAVINAWNNTFMCNAFNGGGIDEEPNQSYSQVGENTFTLNYTTGAGISIGGNGTSCPSGSGVCARDFVTKNVIVGPGPVYCECNADGTACDNASFGGTWSGNILANGADCKCGNACTQ